MFLTLEMLNLGCMAITPYELFRYELKSRVEAQDDMTIKRKLALEKLNLVSDSIMMASL